MRRIREKRRWDETVLKEKKKRILSEGERRRKKRICCEGERRTKEQKEEESKERNNAHVCMLSM